MRNYVIIIASLFVIGLSACNDADTYQTRMENERKILSEYVNREGITEDKGGVYFQVLSEPKNADAVKVEIGCKVKVYYTGYFLDGKVFDSNVLTGKFEPLIVWILGNRQGQIIRNGGVAGSVISGWMPGLLAMKEGMKARIVVPSSLAYGMRQSGSIPSFTPLVFDLEVEKVIPKKKEE